MLYRAKSNNELESIAGTTVASGDTSPIGATMLYDGEDVPTGWQEVEEVYSNPNLLINGDFQVWQRGETFDITNSGNYTYTADRWRVYGGRTGKITKVNDALQITGQNPLQQTVKLKLGTTYTLSAQINGEKFKLTFIAGTPKETDVLAYRTDTDRILIKHTDVIIVEWVKLEQGSIATPFVPKLYGEELLLSQRYYKEIDMVRLLNYTISNNKASYMVKYDMRIAPTINVSGVNVWYTLTDGIAVASPNLNMIIITNKYVVMKCTLPSNQLTTLSIERISLDAEIY